MPRSSRKPRIEEPAVVTGRTPLDRERIARVALSIIDTHGLDGCSMRRLGLELGVEAMALYHHFKSKAALLDAVLELLASEVQIPARGSAPPIDRIRGFSRSYRQLAVRHPKAFILLAARRFNTDRAFSVYEEILTMYADCGLAPREQAYWFRLVGGFASGAGMAYVASIEQIPDASPLQLQHDPQAIPFPHVSASAPFLKVDGLESAFEFGLDVLLDSLARLTGQDSAVHAGPLDGPATPGKRGKPAKRT